MTARPLVSVLIPCYNAADHVGTAIKSALGQSHGDVEVVVLDDGSTDQSLRVINGFGSIVNFRFETGPNRGGNAARNRLIEMSRGAFIQFLDADDELMPSKVELCLQAMRNGADVAFCDYLEVTGANERRVAHAAPLEGSDLLTHFVANNIQTSAPLHRREHLEAIGGFDTTLRCCQEFELHLRLARRCWRRLAHVPIPLYRLLRLPGSVSSNSARVFAQATQILAALHGSLEREGECTEQRREAIALELERLGRALARRGFLDEATNAVAIARGAAPRARMAVGWPNGALTRAFGPVSAERILEGLRRLSGGRKATSSEPGGKG